MATNLGFMVDKFGQPLDNMPPIITDVQKALNPSGYPVVVNNSLVGPGGAVLGSPTLYPNIALAPAAASNQFGSVAVGTTSLAEVRVSNGKYYPVTVPGMVAKKRAVVTNGCIPTNFAAANKWLQCKRNHIARSRVTQIGARLVNFYRDPATWTELTPGASSTYQIDIVVNGVNKGSLTLAGATSMVVADGAIVDTDYLTVDIYPGDVVSEIMTFNNANGIIYEGSTATATRPGYQDLPNGELCYISATALTHPTGGTTITGGTNYTSAMGGSFALFGVSTDPAVLVLGDSIEVGIGEAFTGTIGTRGIFSRSIAPYFATSKYAIGGDGAVKLVASHAKFSQLLDLFTHVVCNYGVNDIINFSQTPAQVLANMSTIAGYCTGLPFYVRTLTPYSASTDNWTTTTGQTPNVNAPNLNLLNNTYRNVPSWAKGCFEFSDPVSTGRDSNIWLADGATIRLNTADGLHPTANASQLDVNAGSFSNQLSSVVAY